VKDLALGLFRKKLKGLRKGEEGAEDEPDVMGDREAGLERDSLLGCLVALGVRFALFSANDSFLTGRDRDSAVR
jgi:hypothetical protein